jgi:uncharacterized protein YegL
MKQEFPKLNNVHDSQNNRTTAKKDIQNETGKEEPQHFFSENALFEEVDHEYQKTKDFLEWRKFSRGKSIKPFADLVEVFHRGLDGEEGYFDILAQKSKQLPSSVRYLYQLTLSALEGKNLDTSDIPQNIVNKFAELTENGLLDIIKDAKQNILDKKDFFNKRLLNYLNGLYEIKKKDITDTVKEKNEQHKKKKQNPFDDSDTSKPSMDEMDRLEHGEEAPAIWSVSPPYGGYLKEKSFNIWEEYYTRWKQKESSYTEITSTDLQNNNQLSLNTQPLTISAEIYQGQKVRLPHFYNTKLCDFTKNSGKLFIDQNGDYVFHTEKTGTVEFIFKKQEKSNIDNANNNVSALEFKHNLSHKTKNFIDTLKQENKSEKKKVYAVLRYISEHLRYSSNSALNEIYNSDPNGYLYAIDIHREADCDVGNTYFAGLCSMLDIPVRHCVGHMLKGKDSEGKTRATSGTGHAWSEVYDKEKNEWYRVDATPPGDPILEEDQDSQDDGGYIDGDYGEQEEKIPTEKELELLREKLKQKREELSYTESERDLAHSAGIELVEARKIMKEIIEAENIQTKKGERVRDILSHLFRKIVDSRKNTHNTYTGPLRFRDGGENIQDIVGHYIGIKTHDFDPETRTIESQEVKEEKVFSGLDVYFVGDKSGSMTNTVDGEAKWKMQQKSIHLILSSLYDFNENLKKEEKRMTAPLDVRTSVISFRGSSEESIDIDKPLGGEYTALQKVQFWQSVGNIGGGNGDSTALAIILNQIRQEKEKLKTENKKDSRIKIVIACSDGSPDDESTVQFLAEELGKENALVVGIGMTETAQAVKDIFDTEYSKGEYIEDIQDLPYVVAKHIINRSIELFPDRVSSQVPPKPTGMI